MKKHILLLLVLGMGYLTAFSSHAAVTVRYDHPENYTDLSLSGSSTPSIQDDLMKQFEKHFKTLGDRYLPKDDTLEIVVLNIDMAGAYEPWQTPNLTNTRIIRDIYPPKFSLQYLWRDGSGKIKVNKQETVSDLNYLMLLDSRQYNPNDPLRYEKTMLERWFRETFSSMTKSTPQ